MMMMINGLLATGDYTAQPAASTRLPSRMTVYSIMAGQDKQTVMQKTMTCNARQEAV
jgi:hypothetical protein